VSELLYDLRECSLSTWTGEAGRCNWCNAALTGRQLRWCSADCRNAAYNNHWFNSGRRAVVRRDESRCTLCREHALYPEVDHITPCRGAHSRWSCLHHLDGLRTLCHPCHVDVTTADRREARS
jgi:hypothetical protein